MKPSTYSIYCSEVNDKHKDMIISKLPFFNNGFNEKLATNLSGNISARISKNQLQIMHPQFIEPNKIASLVSPITSPKADPGNFSSQRVSIQSAKSNHPNITEILLKTMADKRSNLQKSIRNTSNISTSNLLTLQQTLKEGKSVKNISQNMLTKEVNSFSGVNLSFKKSFGHNSNSVASNLSIHNYVGNQKQIGNNDNSVQRRIGDPIESISINENYVPEMSPYNGKKNIVKISPKSISIKEEHLIKRNQRSSPSGKFELEAKRVVLKGNTEKKKQKKIPRNNKNYIITLDDPYEKENYGGGIQIISKDSNSESQITVSKGSTAISSKSYSKKSGSRISLCRERTFSPSIESGLYSRSKDKQSYGFSSTKEASIDRSKRVAYDFESFDDQSLTRDKFQGKKLCEYDEKVVRIIEPNNLYNIMSKDETDLKSKENIRFLHKNGHRTTNTILQCKNASNFLHHTSQRDSKLASKLEKIALLKSPKIIVLENDTQSTYNSPKNITTAKETLAKYSLQINSENSNSEFKRPNNIQPRDLVSNFTIENNNKVYNEKNYESFKIILDVDDEKLINKADVSKNLYKMVEKKYAATSKNKDSKKLDLYINGMVRSKSREKDPLASNSVGIPMFTSSNNIKNPKGNSSKLEISTKESFINDQKLQKQKIDEKIIKMKIIREVNNTDTGDFNTKNSSQLNENDEQKALKYGDDNGGIKMAITFHKIKEVLEFNLLRERKWNEEIIDLNNQIQNSKKKWTHEKNELVDKIRILEMKLDQLASHE